MHVNLGPHGILDIGLVEGSCHVNNGTASLWGSEEIVSVNIKSYRIPTFLIVCVNIPQEGHVPENPRNKS